MFEYMFMTPRKVRNRDTLYDSSQDSVHMDDLDDLPESGDPSQTNDLHVSSATSFNQSFP